MNWLRTQAQQVDALVEDIAEIDRELARTPVNVVDWSAVFARQERLKADRARLVADLGEAA